MNGVEQANAAIEAEHEAIRASDASGPGWPTPPIADAFYGLAGDIVRVIEPHSEADPVALLANLLVGFGSIVGRGPFFRAEADRHYANLFAVLVGETAKGRKGASWGQIRRILANMDPDWADYRIQGGLSSGEGLLWVVRDPIEKLEPVKEKGEVVDYQTVITDGGVEDKRLLVLESEFASVLKVLRREGNTLSTMLRQAWDSGDLRTLTKNNPAVATGAHISVLGHITKNELRRHLDDTEKASGFGNRFLWLCVRRSKVLPEGGHLAQDDLAPLVVRLAEALEASAGVLRMERDDEARRIWGEAYGLLSAGKPGLLGAMMSRAEAQVMRLSCIYALLDSSAVVRAEHLIAGMALWDYAEASLNYIFGEILGDPTADALLDAIRSSGPQGLTRTEARDVFGRHKPASEVARALTYLEALGLARRAQEEGPGRPTERWWAIVEDGATKAT
jgi:hypothetical protein